MKKVILIPDSFKGTMSSAEICTVMAQAVQEYYPDAQVHSVPVADGGEGSVDSFLQAVGGEKVSVPVKGPYFEEVPAFYGMLPDGVAVIEMAAAAGLPLVGERLHAEQTTTYGVGELMAHALERGCKRLVVGLGGSATNDGGCGAAAALGAVFRNAAGEAFVPVGATLAEVAEIDLSGLHPALASAELVTMCDIDNPLCGPLGAAHVFARKTITDEVEDAANQITLEEALRIRPDYRMGDIAEIDVTPGGFLRTAAQTAKQVIMQRIREAEQGKIYDEYSEKENEILTAIVQRVEPKGVYVELGRTEGILEAGEWMPGEEYHIDDHIKVYVLEVNRSGREMLRGPQVRVSRVHVGLVKRLFEMEVPEIAAGVVQIKSIAREAGSRTKMAVHSTEVTIDPVGACVGPRGNRVEKVVAELKNEKIDIIKWSPDPAEFIANALNPAHVLSVFVAENEKACRVVVPDNQLSLAIGKEGQNARLAAKLTGWRIDIKSQSQAAQMFDMPMDDMPEEPMGFQAFYDEQAPLADLEESGLPELRDIPLEMPYSDSEDDTL